MKLRVVVTLFLCVCVWVCVCVCMYEITLKVKCCVKFKDFYFFIKLSIHYISCYWNLKSEKNSDPLGTRQWTINGCTYIRNDDKQNYQFYTLVIDQCNSLDTSRLLTMTFEVFKVFEPTKIYKKCHGPAPSSLKNVIFKDNDINLTWLNSLIAQFNDNNKF